MHAINYDKNNATTIIWDTVATPTTGREACVNQNPFPAIPVAKKIPMTAAEPSVTPLKGPRNNPPI